MFNLPHRRLNIFGFFSVDGGNGAIGWSLLSGDTGAGATPPGCGVAGREALGSTKVSLPSSECTSLSGSDCNADGSIILSYVYNT